jgi:hypothetical protein
MQHKPCCRAVQSAAARKGPRGGPHKLLYARLMYKATSMSQVSAARRRTSIGAAAARVARRGGGPPSSRARCGRRRRGVRAAGAAAAPQAARRRLGAVEAEAGVCGRAGAGMGRRVHARGRGGAVRGLAAVRARARPAGRHAARGWRGGLRGSGQAAAGGARPRDGGRRAAPLLLLQRGHHAARQRVRAQRALQRGGPWLSISVTASARLLAFESVEYARTVHACALPHAHAHCCLMTKACLAGLAHGSREGS